MLPAPDDTLYEALIARDASFEGRAFVAVRTTGIFCRLTCPAPKPRRENSAFYESAVACLEAGFRPCKRCRPLASAAEQDPLVAALLRRAEAEPSRHWKEEDLVALGYDPSTVRRAFRRAFGVTFLQMTRLSRVRRGAESAKDGAGVLDAQLDAGFESPSGFRAAVAGLLGRPPSDLSRASGLQARFVDTPIGPMIAVADPRKLRLLEFADRRELPRELKQVEAEAAERISLRGNPVLERLAAELSGFFSGESASFETPLHLGGRDFARKVWRELMRIPPGTTRSYAQMAEGIGQPGAARAAARANASNRLAIVIPCHRVIGADGGLSGYAGGAWRKAWLLEHERRAFGLSTGQG